MHSPGKVLSALMLISCLSSPVHAGWEVGGGFGDEIFGETPITAHVSFAHGQRFEHVYSLGFISERQTSSRDISPDTGYLSYMFRIPWRRLYFGVGAAVVSDTSEVISTTWEFNESIGWRINDQWTLELRHISNLSIEGRNIGENLFTVIHRFKD